METTATNTATANEVVTLNHAELNKIRQIGEKRKASNGEFYTVVYQNVVCGYFPAKDFEDLEAGKLASVEFTKGTYDKAIKNDKGEVTGHETRPSLVFSVSVTKEQVLANKSYEIELKAVDAAAAIKMGISLADLQAISI